MLAHSRGTAKQRLRSGKLSVMGNESMAVHYLHVLSIPAPPRLSLHQSDAPLTCACLVRLECCSLGAHWCAVRLCAHYCTVRAVNRYPLRYGQSGELFCPHHAASCAIPPQCLQSNLA